MSHIKNSRHVPVLSSALVPKISSRFSEAPTVSKSDSQQSGHPEVPVHAAPEPVNNLQRLLDNLKSNLLEDIRRAHEEQLSSSPVWGTLHTQLCACIKEESHRAAQVNISFWETRLCEQRQVLQALKSAVEATSQQVHALESRPQPALPAQPAEEPQEPSHAVSSVLLTVAEQPASPHVQCSEQAAEQSVQPSLLGLESPRDDSSASPSESLQQLASRQLRSVPVAGSISGLSSPVEPSTTTDVQAFQAVHGWLRDKEPAVEDQRRNWLLAKAGISAAAWLERLERSSIVLILLNLLFMGVDASMAMASVKDRAVKPGWVDAIELLFALAFVLELGLKIGIEGYTFFCGPHWKWNLFDLVLGVSPLLDVLLSFTNLSFMRSAKAFRVIRAARMIKSISYVRELRLMVASIISSLVSLMWSMVLMLLMLYTFSLFVMQTIGTHIEEHGLGSVPEDTLAFYGTVFDSMLSLFMAISGGVDWRDLVAPLAKISRFYVVCFAIYVVFVLFGVMNILTAIFVESAGAISEVDRDLVIQESISQTNSNINAIKNIFQSAIKDGSGRLSKEMLEEQLQDNETLAYLKILGLDVYEARGLFQLLDIDDKDTVEIEEFVCGMMRLKNTGIDIATVMYENKRILTRLTAFMRFVEDNMPRLERSQEVPIAGMMKQYVVDAQSQQNRRSSSMYVDRYESR